MRIIQALWMLSLTCTATNAFVCSSTKSKADAVFVRPPQGALFMVKNVAAQDSKEYWLDEFKAPTGEILNPYKVLKVKRDATMSQIKNAYRDQSRRYHPDTQRYKDMLPGSCNNLDDVRDEWERIKLSYEILRDPRTRKRYDRHEVLADPGAAVGRAVADAALGAVGKGLAGVGSGIFAMGAFALDKLSGENKTKNEQQE